MTNTSAEPVQVVRVDERVVVLRTRQELETPEGRILMLAEADRVVDVVIATTGQSDHVVVGDVILLDDDELAVRANGQKTRQVDHRGSTDDAPVRSEDDTATGTIRGGNEVKLGATGTGKASNDCALRWVHEEQEAVAILSRVTMVVEQQLQIIEVA